MKRLLFAAISGALFGVGLVVSGLSNPDKVLAFLDIAGRWDPSLLLVMLAAAGVTAAGFRLAWMRSRPICAERFHLPGAKAIDTRLLSGAVLFGLGWGITGYCPGPAVTALVINPGEGLWFVASLLVGGWLYSRFPG